MTTERATPEGVASSEGLGAAVADALNDATVPLKCPHCGEGFAIKRTVAMPQTQKMVFAIEHEHPLLSMKTVYGTLEAIEKMLKSTARDLGAGCHVFLEGVDCEPGKTSFRLFIADHDVKKTKKAGGKQEQRPLV